MSRQPNYRITPSLLGGFQRYIDSDLAFEDSMNQTPEGDYKRSLEEIIAEREQALIDSINHIPQEPNEAADKGTCLNEIVDRLILRASDGREDIHLHSGPLMVDNEPTKAIFAEMEGFSFIFDLGLCLELSKRLKNSVPQFYTEAFLPTKYGDVLLYGYIDYIKENKVIDLKTTSIYNFGKFEKGWQRWVYPYCLIESGMMDSVDEFDYLVVKWRSGIGRPLGGDITNEAYTYDHAKSKAELTNMCERFIEWLEKRRDRITHMKVFGAEGY